MRHWVLFTFVMVATIVKSQNINGVVVDEGNEPIAYASISQQ